MPVPLPLVFLAQFSMKRGQFSQHFDVKNFRFWILNFKIRSCGQSKTKKLCQRSQYSELMGCRGLPWLPWVRWTADRIREIPLGWKIGFWMLSDFAKLSYVSDEPFCDFKVERIRKLIFSSDFQPFIPGSFLQNPWQPVYSKKMLPLIWLFDFCKLAMIGLALSIPLESTTNSTCTGY